MNSSSLQNPRPSNGFKDWPTLGSHGSHSEPNQLPGPGIGQLMAPSHSNNVHQLMANPNASYPFFVGAFQNGWQQAYIEGMPLFINLQNDRGEKTTISGRHQSHNIMASVQVLNYYLTLGSSDPIFIQQHIRKHRLNESLIPMYPTTAELVERFKRVYFNNNGALSDGPTTIFKNAIGNYIMHNGEFDANVDKTSISSMYTRVLDNNLAFSQNNDEVTRNETLADDALQEKIRVLRDIMFVEDFNKKWSFMGVILTDMDLNSRYQKLFNLNVRGRSRIFNVWNSKSAATNSMHGRRDHVQKGDELYFTLKKVAKDPSSTYLTPDGTQMAIIPTGDRLELTLGGTNIEIDTGDLVWQIVPTRKSLNNVNHDDHFNPTKMPYNLRLNSRQKRSKKIKVEHDIHVGKVLNSVAKRPEQYFTARAMREHTQMALLPMLEIAIRIGGY